MHQDLEAWLDKVWTERDRIIAESPTGHSGRGVHLGDKNPAIWNVYRIYNSLEDGGGAIGSSDRASVADFIDELDKLEKHTGIDPVVQIGSDAADLTRGSLVMIKSNPITCETRDGKKIDLSLQRIGTCFVHFSKGGPATHRIYLNILPAYLGGAFRRIYTLINDERTLSSAKVTGPLARVRADSIVIYLTGRDGIKPVTEKIQTYHAKNKSQFGAAVPRLTTPVKGMQGVSIGMEPPSITVVRSGGSYYAAESAQSFGFYRASLIFMALDRTRFTAPGQGDTDRARAFKRRAAKYFRAAGIDPDRPSEQDVPPDLKPLIELEYWIEGELEQDGDYYKPGAKVHVKKK